MRRALQKARRRDMERAAGDAAAAPGDLVVREFSDCEPADLRFFASAVMAAGKHVLAFQRSQPAHVVVGRGRGDFDLRAVSARLFALLGGKGGGSASLLEGRGR